jgi:tetratricopeptide (TPR) repeat protein
MPTSTPIGQACKHLCALCAAAMLLACSAPAGSPLQAPRTAQLDGEADGYYALGRYHYGARRYEAAGAAYQQALALAPLHVDARNGMAAVHAARGELAAAIAIWRELTASGQQPAGRESAFLFNNLGYAYLLAGDAVQAAAALERACLLDPLDSRAWESLGEALHRLGEHERAQQMTAQADSLRGHDLKADVALAQAGGEHGWTGAQVYIGASNDSRLPLAQAVPLPGAVPQLEISNGNGVKGMAAALGRTVDRNALRLVRLSNQRGFGVQRTRVEYQDGHEQAARTLAAHIRPAPLLQLARIDGAAIRLVIGHDLLRDKALPQLALR